jgi:hypothetical protein
MSRVAIAGRMYSGKTTLANELVEHHGWYRIGYNDLLKEWLAEALTNIGVPTKVDDIIANKARYRVILQELGNLVGFNDGFGVEQAIGLWEDRGAPEPVIFDNVRFDAQFRELERFGFVLVELDTPRNERIKRAAELGVDEIALNKVDSHFSEGAYTPEVRIPTYLAGVDELGGLFVRMFGDNKKRIAKARRQDEKVSTTGTASLADAA